MPPAALTSLTLAALTTLALAPPSTPAPPLALAASLTREWNRLVLAEDAGAGVGQEVIEAGGFQPAGECGRVRDGVRTHGYVFVPTLESADLLWYWFLHQITL